MNIATPKKIMFFITLLGLVFFIVYIFVAFMNNLLHFSIRNILKYIGIPFFSIIILITIVKLKNDYTVETIFKKTFFCYFIVLQLYYIA